MSENVGHPVPDWIAPLLAEIEAGQGLSLSAAGRLFPAFRGQGRVGPSTTFRWATKGAKAQGGELVKLEAIRVGGRWLTSRSAITRFVAALTEHSSPAGAPPSRTPSQRRRACEAANQRLKQMGA